MSEPARAPLGVLQHDRLNSIKQRTYGRRKAIPLPRAVLKEFFVNDNELEKGIASLSLDNSKIHSPSNSGHVEPINAVPNQKYCDEAKRERKNHDGENPSAISSPDFLRPLLLESGSVDGPIDFSKWTKHLYRLFRVTKLAEGSYGDVYTLSPRSIPGSKSTKLPDHHSSAVILKVIPLHTNAAVPPAPHFSLLPSVLQEVKLLKRLDSIAGFTRFRELHLLSGRFPPPFNTAFTTYKSTHGTKCLNPDPATFAKSQVYAVMEMNDAGTDLEELTAPSVCEVYDIFWQLVVLLANAEEEVRFEHRDLHVSNVCILQPQPTTANARVSNDVSSAARAKSLLGRSGLRTTIIDYTFSRAELHSHSNAAGTDGEVAYNPMSDPSIFNAKGRTKEEKHQFATYRRMRACVEDAAKKAGKAETGKSNRDSEEPTRERDKWSRFVPQTNVLWLAHILYVLVHRSAGRLDPATDGDNPGNEAQGQVQRQMYTSLHETLQALEQKKTALLPQSARELLLWGEERGWVRVDDVLAFRREIEREAEGDGGGHDE